jgi:hypothetical protein
MGGGYGHFGAYYPEITKRAVPGRLCYSASTHRSGIHSHLLFTDLRMPRTNIQQLVTLVFYRRLRGQVLGPEK